MKANPHFCSPKLYFLPNMQMSKNTQSRMLRIRGRVRVFRLVPDFKKW